MTKQVFPVAILMIVAIVLPCSATQKTELAPKQTEGSEALHQKMKQAFPLEDLRLRSLSGIVFSTDQVESYRLSKQPVDNESNLPQNRWGYFVQFTAGGFSAWNFVRCGNATRFTTSGKWKWIAENRIEVYDATTVVTGQGAKPNSEPEPKYIGVFEVRWVDKEKTALELARVKAEAKDTLEERMSREFPIAGLALKSARGHVFEHESVDNYQLGLPPKDKTEHPFPSFGQYVHFGDETFEASNSTMCGNDVHIVTTGTWKWVAENQIEVFVESIQRNEYCHEPSEEPQKVIGTFEVSWLNKDRTAILLKRTEP